MSTSETSGQWPGNGAGPTPPPSATDGFFNWIREQRIVRSTTDRWVGGVASGVARRLGIDPLIVRGVLFVSIFLGGLGLISYALAWALLPEESDGRIHAEEMFRGRFDPAIIGAGILLLVGVIRPDNWGFGPWRVFNILTWVAAIVVIVLLVSKGYRERRQTMSPPNQPTSPGSYEPGPPTTPLWAEGTGQSSPTVNVTMPIVDNLESDSHTSGSNSTDETSPNLGKTDAEETIRMTNPISAPLPPEPNYGGYRGGPPLTPTMPYMPPTPPLPIKPPVKGPGRTWSGIVVALCFFAIAGLVLADRFGYLWADLPGAIFGTCVAILGLGVAVAGFLGRRSGVLGALAIITFLVGVPASTVIDGLPDRLFVNSSDAWQPVSATDASKGSSTGAGNFTLDVTKLKTSSETINIPIDSIAGKVTVIVPKHTDVTINTRVVFGNVDSELDWERKNNNRGNRDSRTYFTGESMPEQPEIAIDVDLTFGNLTILEKS